MNISEHTYLFTIADRFSIEGHGVVVVPGIPHAAGTPVVHRGDPLILRTPLGEVIHTNLQDIELIRYMPGAKRLEATPISLPQSIHKFDIPIGTEVYLASDATEKPQSEQGVTPQPAARSESDFSGSLLPST
jgi:hypothetical protein